MERVKIKIKPSFYVFIVAAVVFRQGYFAATYAIAVLLHELSHYLVASKLFYHCNEIQLSIFGAVLYGEFQDVTPGDRVKIALAGPACNLILCVICSALWWIAPETYYYTEDFFFANISMALVNMLPCYPLDGGRVLTGLLEKKLDKRAVKVTKVLTVAVSLALFGVFVLSLFTRHNLFNVGAFAVCLFSGIFATGKECYVRTAFSVNRARFLRKGMEKKTLVFSQNNKLSDVAKRMQGNFLYFLEVVDDDMQVVARYSVTQLEELIIDTPLDTPLNSLRRY